MKIGRYTVLDLLGRGGTGKVYLARLPVVGAPVAIKRLDPHPHLLCLMGEDRLNSLFEAEARTMASLRHPNITPVRDYDTDQGRPFYVMDYCADNLGGIIGETARIEAESRALRIDRAVDYTRQTLAGLARLHHAGIIHRDIKPFNLLVTEADIVRICDFGFSRLRGERFDAPDQLKVGTPYYSPPEQETDPDAVDETADLFAVGVILYRMLTGTLPAPDRILPSRINPDLTSGWDAFFDIALADRPAGRFPDARTMADELDRLFAAWQSDNEAACRLNEPEPSPAAVSTADIRREAAKVRPGEAASRFGLDDLYRPARYVANDFLPPENGVIRDRATGLAWQWEGSLFPMGWSDARDYVEALNKGRFGGMTGWRLPTVDELITLLTPTPHGADFCAEPVFDHIRNRLWSADRATFTASWFVSLDMGFVSRRHVLSPIHVRAVT